MTAMRIIGLNQKRQSFDVLLNCMLSVLRDIRLYWSKHSKYVITVLLRSEKALFLVREAPK